MELRQYLSPLPLIAVLRGITPEEVPAIAGVLFDEGFRVLEVPLNSPRPFESIRLLAREFRERCLIGAGTVIRRDALFLCYRAQAGRLHTEWDAEIERIYDLRNEPLAYRGMATWEPGSRNPDHNLRWMYERVGGAIQAIDPDKLIICEGPQNYRTSFAGRGPRKSVSRLRSSCGSLGFR